MDVKFKYIRSPTLTNSTQPKKRR